MNKDNTKEKTDNNQSCYCPLYGIKILTITTKMPSFKIDLLSVRNGTNEASL